MDATTDADASTLEPADGGTVAEGEADGSAPIGDADAAPPMPSCSPDASMCSGSQPLVCSPSGRWAYAGSSCSQPTPVCSGGACTCPASLDGDGGCHGCGVPGHCMLAVPLPQMVENYVDDAGTTLTMCAPPLDPGQCMLYLDLGNAVAVRWDAGPLAEVLEIPSLVQDVPVLVTPKSSPPCIVHVGYPGGSCSGSLPDVSFTMVPIEISLAADGGGGGPLPMLGCDEAVPNGVGPLGPSTLFGPVCGSLCADDVTWQIQHWVTYALTAPSENAVTAAIENRSCLY